MKHILSFSGGKDSTAMLVLMLEKRMQVDEIIFCDTTKEFPQMYKHIEKVKECIQRDITTIHIPFDYWFKEHVKTRGINKGKKGYGWPDFRNRWCTALKRDGFKRIISKYNNVVEYHGIAYDEKYRCDKNQGRNIKYPLVEWGMTEKNALDFCYNKGFDWGGLYDDFGRVSCWCCPLSRIGEFRNLYHKYPELWSDLKEMDKHSYRRFRSDYSVNELERKFHSEPA